MADKLISFLQEAISSNELIVFFMSMLPITELRATIPWGLTYGEMTWMQAGIIAVLGNFIITIPILFYIDTISNYFRKWERGDRFFLWLFNRTRRKGKVIERIEFWGLVVFVGIPLPITGAWTGALAAFLFGLPIKRSLFAILLGLIVSATIVTIATISGIWFVN
ncbi:MAG: small multi-drug export protein [Candidatus Marinimicrobia bacterium]|nr:small multi-drug export protein [Candidatus Neomarinimicrobiota bacterium]MBL7023029.1 small multi-drug export protein [Candidatus Neomarinimicrobiota bacterium]